jgi:death-on-curing protein
MITKKEILQLHELSIQTYGGAHGIRDEGMLESAIARPFQTFGGEDLYPTVYEKAAAFAESLIINHPFVDGNKRTGFAVMLATLRRGNIKLTASQNDTYNFVIAISTGEMKFEAIVEWLKENTKTL